MKVHEIMTRQAHVIAASSSIREAAELMVQHDIGCVPVHENEKLVGMVTDRDLVVRALAHGRNGEISVQEIMTAPIRYCHDDEDVNHVARNMADEGIRRLPVVDRDKRLVGFVSLSNVTASKARGPATELLKRVAVPH